MAQNYAPPGFVPFTGELDAPTQKNTAPPGFVPFDGQLDAPTRTLGSVVSDLAKSVKVGAQQLPGMATGLLDLPIAAATGERPFTQAADAIGEATGFQPGKWAKETQFSPAYEQSRKDIDKAWEEGGVGNIASAYLKNPAYVAGQVAESLPSMAAGGLIGRAALGAGAVAARAAGAAEGAAARAATPGLMERALGKWATPAAGGLGEGAVTAGQQMDQYTGDDQQKNALASLGAGIGTGALGVGAGRLANKLGLETAETAIINAGRKGAAHAADEAPMSAGRRILGGATSEALLQELPQSAQEQMWQNYADDKPLMEGVARQAVEGAIAGGVMGAGANLRGPHAAAAQQRAINAIADQSEPRAQPLLLGNTPPERLIVFPDGSVGRTGEAESYINSLPEDQQQDAHNKLFGRQFTEADAPRWWENYRDGQAPAPVVDYLAEVRHQIASGTPFTTQDTVNVVRNAMEDAWLAENVGGTGAGSQVADATGARLQAAFGQTDQANATAAVDARVRTGRVLSGLQNILDDGPQNTTQVLGQLNQNLTRVQEAPLAADETQRVRRIVDAYMGFKGAGEKASLPADRMRATDQFAKNASMEALIPQRPSEAMGINPAAGPLSKAAATAVDTGVAQAAGAAATSPQPSKLRQYLDQRKSAQPAGENLAPQAVETQQAAAQPAQARGQEVGAGAIQAAAAQTGGSDVQAAGLTDAATTENTGAQAAPAASTPGQAQAPAVAQPGGSIRLGRDSIPLHEGGKPFATQQAASEAKRLQPAMRVVRDGKGYVLVEKTAAQLAAQAKAARRLANPMMGARGVPTAAHEFIAGMGGLNRSLANDLGIDGNPRVGNRRLFAGQGKGMSAEQATEALSQAGYVQDGDQRGSMEMIRRSLTQPQYTPEGWQRIAEAEHQTRYDDHLQAQQDAALADDYDPFAPTSEFTREDFEADPEYDQATPAIKTEVRALLTQAEAMGIDTEVLQEDAARQTESQSEQDYYDHLKRLTTDAIARTAGGDSTGAADQNGQGQWAEAKPASAGDRGPNDGQAGRAEGAGLDLPRPYTALSPQERQAFDQRHGISQSQRDAVDFKLESQTRQEALSEQQRSEQADRQDAKARAEQEHRAQTDAERSNFTLTGSDRATDVAESRGQDALFSRKADTDQTKTPEFKRWFGDSKVVDAQGKPLVVYRYAKNESDIAGGVRFFSKEADYAESYFEEVGRGDGLTAAVYLSLRDPLVVDLGAREFSDPVAERPHIEKAMSDGRDGVVFRNGGDEFYVAFRPEQIKSAIGNNGNFDPANPDIRYSRAAERTAAEQQAADARVAKVGRIVDWIGKRWKNAPEIVVADDMTDERIPQQVRDADARQRSQGATGNPEGFFHGGKVYVLASEVSSPADVARVVMHEALGHYGLRGVFGDRINTVLNQVLLGRRKDVIARAREYGLVGDGIDSHSTDAEVWASMSRQQHLEAAEEVLAFMAQEHPNLTFVQRAVAAIRTWVRENLPSLASKEMTDAEVIRNFILPARGFVKRGGDVNSAVTAFSRGKTGAVPEINAPGPQGAAQEGATRGNAGTSKFDQRFMDNDMTGLAERAKRVAYAEDGYRLPNLSSVLPKNQVPPESTHKTVTLYRGVPASVSDARVRPGDWVSLSKEYAERHGTGQTGRNKIVSVTVPASDVVWAGTEMTEFFYAPQGLAKPGERAVDLLNRLGKDGFDAGTNPNEQSAPESDGALFARSKAMPGAQGSRTDRAVMDMLREGKPAKDVLGLIASASKSRFNQQVARLLMKTGIDPKMEALAVGGLGSKNGFNHLAKYSRAHDTVSLTDGAGHMAEQIVLHELIHAATLKALDRKGLASLQMRRLYQHVLQNGNLGKAYGMKNVGEFVAEAFTNPEFQRALKNTTAPAGGTIKTAWDGFVRILRTILGLPQDQTNALSKALELGVAVMRENKAIREQAARSSGDAYMQSPQTRSTFESRIDALFNGAKATTGTRVLDRSDVMGLLGYPNVPLMLNERHLLDGLTNHPEMTAAAWKKVPGWLENPAMVYRDPRDTGRLVLIAPESLAGYPVMLVIEPKPNPANSKPAPTTPTESLLVTVYAKTSGNLPAPGFLASGGNLLYMDTKNAPEIWRRGGVQFPKQAALSLGRAKILTEKNLAGWRKANAADEGDAHFGAQDEAKFSRAAKPAVQYDTQDQQRAAERAFGAVTKQTLKERAQSLRANMGVKLRQGLVDQFAPIKDVSEKAYILARLSKGSEGATEAAMLYGKPFLRDGVYDVDIKDGGFAKVLAGLKGEHDRFFQWVAALRAERLKSEGKENLLTDQDITALKTLNQGAMADGSARPQAYMQALQQLNAFNEANLRVAKESGLIDQAAYDLMKDQPYVPFYRLMEKDGAMTGPRFSSGLTNQQAWKKLKGGTQQLNGDLLQNTLLNWSHLYAAAARNRAALETMSAAEKMDIAYRVPADTKGAVKVMRDGVAEHWAVEDPYLLDAISAISYAGNELAKTMAPFKRLLTLGVTINPTFKIRNLIRDSLSAVAQADMSYNPLDNLAKGWKATASDSQIYASMLAGGGVIKFGTQEDTSRMRHQIESLGGTMLDKHGWGKLSGQMKALWGVYEEFGDRTENVNRAALYERLIAKGVSHAEASFMARDLMDFSMSGKWEVVRFLTQTVPFMNARLQGLYKLGRAAKEDPRRFAAMAGAVSLASLGLMAAYSDDDDWKRREDWDRDAYWWFKIGDKAFRIPKPFELGSIGTMAERTAELMFSKEMTAKRFGQRVSEMVFSTFAMDPTPQFIKPFVDVYANKDSFTGKPIEGMADERLRPQDRYNERTSEVARLLGQIGLPDPVQLAKGQYSGLSPKQVDFLLRGYFGWLATASTTVTDTALRPMLGRGERPAMQLRDTFLAGNFLETLPTGSSRYVTAMYEQAKDVEQAWASYQAALKSGDRDKAREIMQDEGAKLRTRGALENAKRIVAEQGQMAKRIESDKTLSADEKRARLDAINERKHQAARRVALMS